MIHIIEHGAAYFKRTVTCPTCKCKFEYELQDVSSTRNDGTTASYFKYWITCPECKAQIILSGGY